MKKSRIAKSADGCSKFSGISNEKMQSILDEVPYMDSTKLSWMHMSALRLSQTSFQYADSARRIVDAIGREASLRSAFAGSVVGPFRWPSTKARTGDGSLMADEWQEKGVLQWKGYSVGSTSVLGDSKRRQLLSEIFQGPLPSEFVGEWGQSHSQKRLKKLANTIASLTRNAKRRRNATMGNAIRDWEEDLYFLKQRFYLRHFQFRWPAT